MTKTKRFEIFKRDSFTCQYCGQRPPDVVLEVDHIHPSSKGGDNDDLNLITSCFECNRGKRDKVLTEKSIRPDADLEFLRIQQEMAEAQRYLKAKQHLEVIRSQLISSLQDTWEQYLQSGDLVPNDVVIARWLINFSPEDIERAIKITSCHFANRQWGEGLRVPIAYASGVLWRMKRENEPEFDNGQNPQS